MTFFKFCQNLHEMSQFLIIEFSKNVLKKFFGKSATLLLIIKKCPKNQTNLSKFLNFDKID